MHSGIRQVKRLQSLGGWHETCIKNIGQNNLGRLLFLYYFWKDSRDLPLFVQHLISFSPKYTIYLGGWFRWKL